MCTKRTENASDDDIECILEEARREQCQPRLQSGCSRPCSKKPRRQTCFSPAPPPARCTGRTVVNCNPGATGDQGLHQSRYRGVNRSRRFSVRVTEALRALQREKQTRNPECMGSSTMEIIDYVSSNFCHDGDLEAQVRTALKRSVCQGFVKKDGCDSYRLIGPFACLIRECKDKCLNKCNAEPKKPHCKKPPPNNCTSENGSDDDLSIPTSAEEDILRNRIEQDIDRLQRGEGSCLDVSPPEAGDCVKNECPSSCPSLPQRSSACAPPQTSTPRVASPPCLPRASPICTPRRSCLSPPLRRSAQKQRVQRAACRPASTAESSAGESPDEVGAIENPLEGFEVGVNLDDFQNNNSSEEESASDQEESEDEEADDASDDVASDDSALDAIRARNPRGAEDNRELKRWIRNCRRECARRAAEQLNPANVQ